MRPVTEAERPALARPSPRPRPTPGPRPIPGPPPAAPEEGSGRRRHLRRRAGGPAIRRGDRTALGLALLMVLAGLGLLLWSPWRPAGAASPAPHAVRPPAAEASPAAGPAAGPAVGPTAVGSIVPTWLAIPAIGVDAPVEARGTVRTTNPFTGQVVDGFGVPDSMRTTAWWSDGPKPGSGQMAVILGHTQVGGYGVFNRLGQLRPGDVVTLHDRSGAVLHLQVLAAPLTGLDKSTPALAHALDAHPQGADLALVTCGGRFDEALHQSVDNTVVFATILR